MSVRAGRGCRCARRRVGDGARDGAGDPVSRARGINARAADTPTHPHHHTPTQHTRARARADSGKWRGVATTGTPLSERTARVAAAVGTKIFIFGGGSLGNVPVDDSSVHILDTVAWSWSQPATTGAAPMCRQGHSMTAVGDKVFVFAGSAGTSIFSDLWCLDTGSMTWSEVEENGGSPPARTAHAAAAIGTCLFVSGGLSLDRASGAPEALGDLWCFDTATQTWSLPQLGTAPFNPRLGHSMCAVPVFALQGGADTHEGSQAADPAGAAGAAGSGEQGGADDAEPAGGGGGQARDADATAVDSMVADTAGLGITDVTPMFSTSLPAVDQLRQAAASTPLPASTLHADGLLIFGGADIGGNIFDDLMLLCPKK